MKHTPAKFILLFLLIGAFPASANTTRDLGPEPELNSKKIGAWISFYTNLERISRGLNPLLYESILEKAAEWQAGYCAKIKNLNHNSAEPGMRTVKDRVEHFGGSYNTWGENLTVQFSINSEGVMYYIKSDGRGEYKDYGSHAIYWRDDRQMAYVMVRNWMTSPGHRANILNAGFSLIGAAAAKGVYSGEKSYYGCQVFGARTFFLAGEKAAESEFAKLSVARSGAGGKNSYSISYNGRYDVMIIEINGGDKPVSHPVEKNGNSLLFRPKMRPKGLLFAALHDKVRDIIYPVKMLQ